MLPGNGCYRVCLSSVTVTMAAVFRDTYRDEILLREITEKVVYIVVIIIPGKGTASLAVNVD